MGEETQASLLQSPMEITVRPGLSKDHARQNHFGMSPKGMGQKKNLCTVPEDNLGTSSIIKETPVHKNRIRKAGGFNLRKSLAWNQAFFTEEGVLNPLELSILNGSPTISSGNVLSGTNVRPPLHDLEENVWSKVHEKSQTKDTKANKLFSKPESSSNEEPEAHVPSGKKLSAKSITKSVPRSPVSYSQKRVANVNTTNPTSKIPKFMPTKSHASSHPTTSRNVMLPTKSSKSDQSIAKVTVGQTIGSRGCPVNNKRDFGLSSSSAKFSADYHGKNTVKTKEIYETSQVEKGTSSLKVIPDPSSSNKLHEPVSCAGSGKVACSIPQSIHHVYGGPPAPVHARPSALRMPSPSLGFFCQGNVSPSYINQSQRNTQPSESKIPSLRKPMDLRQVGELRSLTTTTGRQPTKGISATKSRTFTTKSSVGAVISSSSQTCLAANFLNPPATPDTHLPVRANLDIMMQSNMMERGDSINFGSSDCQRNGQEQPNNDCLLVVHNIDKLSQELSLEIPDPDRIKVPYNDYTLSQISSESVEGSVLNPKYLKSNFPDNVCASGPSTRYSKGSEVCPNFSSQTCFPRKLRQSDSMELQEGDSGTDTIAKHSLVGDTRDETCTVTSESKQSAQNTDINSDLESGHTAINIDCAASAEAETSFGQSKVQMAGADIDRSLEVDSSLTQNSGVSVQTTIQESGSVASGLSSTLLEEFQLTLFENTELQDCRLQCDLTNKISSANEDVLMQDKEMFTDTSNKEGVLSKRQLNAVPFSDEWVAALEVFGEDILELKTGPVQNSPPDKELPEPNPWSPVKRKAQDIGPFDCTKYPKNLSISNTQ